MIYDKERYEKRIICWTSISETNPENGGLYVVPKSHMNGILPHEPSNDFELDMQALGFTYKDAHPMVMRAGDILVIHPLLVHGSPENKTEKDRIALIVGLQVPKAYNETEAKIRVEILKNNVAV